MSLRIRLGGTPGGSGGCTLERDLSPATDRLLVASRCQMIWYGSKYPQAEFFRIGPCGGAAFIFIAPDLVGREPRKIKL